MKATFLGLALLAISTPGGDTLRGVVVTDADEPLADALVTLLPQGTGDGLPIKVRSKPRGEFEIAVPHEATFLNYWLVVAYKPGWAIGGSSLQIAPNNPTSVRLKLDRAVKISARVLSPDNQPVERAVLVPEYVETTAGPLWIGSNSEFESTFATTTDKQGVATIETLGAKGNARILVKTGSHGMQSHLIQAGASPAVLKLQPGGRLHGRVTADDAAAVRGLRIAVSCRPAATKRGAPVVLGQAEALTGDDGRFEIPAIVQGEASIRVRVNEALPFRLTRPAVAHVKVGQTTTVELPLARGVHVRGQVVERDSSKPIAGAVVIVSDQTGYSRTIVTGGNGVYEATVAADQVRLHMARVPQPYIPPAERFRTEKTEAGAMDLTLRPFMLERGVSLRGVVVDEEDRPVFGAFVHARWRQQEGQYATLGEASATSNDRGEFVLEAVARDVPLGLTARTTSRANPQIVQVQASAGIPPRIRVLPKGVVTVVGRVLDTDGEPIAGATLRFMGFSLLPSGENYGQYPVTFENGQLVTTDELGRFKSPQPLPRFTTYTITVEAKGSLPHGTEQLKLTGDDATFTVPDIRLARVRGVRGLVVDSAGKPLAGVAVTAHPADPRMPASTESGADGAFTLDSIHPQAAFVFVRKPKYRQVAVPLPMKSRSQKAHPTDGENLRIVLKLANEDSASVRPRKTVRHSALRTRELLRRLLLPVFERVSLTNEPKLGYSRREVLILLARHDPTFAREHLDEVKSPHYRADVLLTLGEIDDALAVAETVEDGYLRTQTYLNVADHVADPDRRREILAQALVHARTVTSPPHRALLLGGVAKRLMDAGEPDAARRVLDDGHRIARALATSQWSGFARGNFAETLALVDPAAARDLVKDLAEGHARHHGNIAHRLAATNPEKAEQFLKEMHGYPSITTYGVRVCYRMAPVDPERARAIADKLAQPEQRAHALGVMALALAEKSPEAARELLHSAFDQLDGRAAPDSWNRRRDFPVAATLVRISERVDPVSTGDYLARAMSLHPGPGLPAFDMQHRAQEHAEQTASLVLLLAAYGAFPEETKRLADPLFVHANKLGGAGDRHSWYRANALFTAMALADPERAIAWFHDFYPRITGDDLRVIPQPWMTLATAIAADEESLWTHITYEVFHLWAVDREDL